MWDTLESDFIYYNIFKPFGNIFSENTKVSIKKELFI